jgi:hypothetical protein
MRNDTDARLVGRVLFTDGVERDVFEDADGWQWVTSYDGERVYGVWMMPADEPVVFEWGPADLLLGET